MNSTPNTPPAGWYADDEYNNLQRYWDGQQWTDQYRPAVSDEQAPEPTWLQRNRSGLIAAGAAVVGLFVLAGISNGGNEAPPAAQPTVTVTPRVVDEPEPVSKPKPKPTPEDTIDEDTLNDLALDLTWDAMSRSERDLMCNGFWYDPQMMWESFDEGADGSISRASFMRFMRGKC